VDDLIIAPPPGVVRQLRRDVISFFSSGGAKFLPTSWGGGAKYEKKKFEGKNTKWSLFC